jgi:hypothetical protein
MRSSFPGALEIAQQHNNCTRVLAFGVHESRSQEYDEEGKDMERKLDQYRSQVVMRLALIMRYYVLE